VNDTDVIINISDTSSPRTVTLPTPSSLNNGKSFIITDTSGGAGTNAITISPASGTIDGQASLQISDNYGSLQVFSDGSNYYTYTVSSAASTSLWQSYTTTIQATTTNPTPGAGFQLNSHYLKQGKTLYIKAFFSQTVAGTTGSGDYFYNLPPGFTADTSVTEIDPGDSVSSTEIYPSGPNIGLITIRSSNINNFSGIATLRSTTTYRLCAPFTGVNLRWQTSTWYDYADTTTQWSANLSIPIL